LHESAYLDNTAKIIRRFWISTNAVILFAEKTSKLSKKRRQKKCCLAIFVAKLVGSICQGGS
jgi:hypothetical protein